MKKAKTYQGNLPDLLEYKLIGEVEVQDSWIIFFKEGAGNLINIKIVLKNGRLRKANYWTTFNKDSGIFFNNKDLILIKEHESELLFSSLIQLRKFFNIDNSKIINIYDYVESIKTPVEYEMYLKEKKMSKEKTKESMNKILEDMRKNQTHG